MERALSEEELVGICVGGRPQTDVNAACIYQPLLGLTRLCKCYLCTETLQRVRAKVLSHDWDFEDFRLSLLSLLATALEHPFAGAVHLEKDLQFALEMSVRLGLQVEHFRDRLFLSTADDGLLSRAARQVAAVCVVSILEWSDQDLPKLLVYGFPIVADIPPSSIFRPVPPQPLRSKTLLGHDAAKYVESLEHDLRLPSKTCFDQLYGVGQWHPLKATLCTRQMARRSECTDLREAIVNQGPDFAAAVVKFLANLLFQCLSQRKPHARPSVLAAFCPWFRIQVETEDFWKGYKQNHVPVERQGVNVIAFVYPIPRKRVYAQMYGMPFGVSAAVN